MEQSSRIIVKFLCERTESGLFAEPLNAVSSMAFMLVAYLVIRYRNSQHEIRGKNIADIHLLTLLIGFIGIGSFTFHTLSTTWAELMDIVPIVLFILVYFVCFLLRVVRCGMFQVAVALVAFLGFTYFIMTAFPGAFNNSIAYLSTMGALCAMAIYLNIMRRPSARMYLMAALIGCISLFFRSIDMMVCDMVSVGTHFIWHSLNAVVIYILMIQLIHNVDRRARMLKLASLHHA